MNDYDSTKDTMQHIENVQAFLGEIQANIAIRSLLHDRSKLQSPEKEMFDEFTPKLCALTYGSMAYRQALVDMGPALEHHYVNNTHHPEHYGYAECDLCFTHHPRDHEGRCNTCQHGTFTLRPDVSKMTLLDVLEMLADWRAAGMRHADGDFAKSLEINQARFEIPDYLQQMLIATAKELGWI